MVLISFCLYQIGVGIQLRCGDGQEVVLALECVTVGRTAFPVPVVVGGAAKAIVADEVHTTAAFEVELAAPFVEDDIEITPSLTAIFTSSSPYPAISASMTYSLSVSYISTGGIFAVLTSEKKSEKSESIPARLGAMFLVMTYLIALSPYRLPAHKFICTKRANSNISLLYK